MNGISLSVVYLAFLSLPGIVGSRIYRQLTQRRSRKNWEDFVEVLLFALFSYLVCILFYWVWNLHFRTQCKVDVFDTLKNLAREDLVFHWLDIALASFCGAMLGYVAAYLNKYMVITRIGRKIRATNRYGDEDVWNFFHDSKRPHSWVFVRDHKLNLLYFGEIFAYSDSDRDRELILKNVTVHDNASGNALYKRDVLYLSRDRFDLTIEIPDLQPSPTALMTRKGKNKNA